jgi:hypothetical protein
MLRPLSSRSEQLSDPLNRLAKRYKSSSVGVKTVVTVLRQGDAFASPLPCGSWKRNNAENILFHTGIAVGALDILYTVTNLPQLEETTRYRANSTE